MRKWLLKKFQKFIGFEKVKEIRMLSSVMLDLCDMAQGSHPKEMMVFLSSTKGNTKGIITIDEIQIQAYYASTGAATVPIGQLPPVTNIIGTVHSHPSSSRRPSNQDLSLFSHYGLVHGIIGYPYNQDSITFYDKRGNIIPVSLHD